MSLKEVKKSVELSRKLPKEMKELIIKQLTPSSRYKEGRVYGLKKVSGMSKITSKISGVSFGADKDGFFVYTHRCRSKSYKNPLKMLKKNIDFVESTG